MMIDITTIKELMTDDNKVDDLIGALQFVYQA